MTEDEAKNQYCPIAKLRPSYDGNWDRGQCIASKCMWWRWIVTLEGPDHGYCGLAGHTDRHSVGKP